MSAEWVNLRLGPPELSQTPATQCASLASLPPSDGNEWERVEEAPHTAVGDLIGVIPLADDPRRACDS